jgi:hypothetical protein
MPNTAQVTFTISNQAFQVAALLKGISFVGGVTVRGPVNDPKTIITSWPQFIKIFGGLTPVSDFPLLAKRALDYGAQLRVARILNYTDPADATTGTGVKATITPFQNTSPATLFALTMKNPGADYNNLRIDITAASNGNSRYFNLVITHVSDSSIFESWQNLTIPGTASFGPTVANSHYLDDIIRGSQLVNVTYSDLSAIADGALLNPVVVTKTPTGGTDGSTIVVADYVGDAAGGTGLHAFDGYDDALQMGFPEISTDTLHIAGSAYAENRQDIMYFGHIDNSFTTATAIIGERDGMNIDSMYTAFFAGGLRVLDPVSQVEKSISELGDIFGICSYSDTVAHEWYSFAGTNRGKFRNALGVVNNFGTPAFQADLNIIANHQVNMAVVSGGICHLSGNFTAILSTSPLSFTNAVRGLIFVMKSLRPGLKRHLEQPCDLPEFKKIFREVEPFLDSMVTGRFWFSYVWDGDQTVSKIEDVRVNDLAQLQQGKYKAKLYAKLIPSMQEIAIEIVVTALNVQFTVLQQQPTA